MTGYDPEAFEAGRLAGLRDGRLSHHVAEVAKPTGPSFAAGWRKGKDELAERKRQAAADAEAAALDVETKRHRGMYAPGGEGPVRFDLTYVIDGTRRTMSCGILRHGLATMVGPFPAHETGPIIDALFAEEALGFNTPKEAEHAYLLAHFNNMSRGENDHGIEYPFMVGGEFG